MGQSQKNKKKEIAGFLFALHFVCDVKCVQDVVGGLVYSVW